MKLRFKLSTELASPIETFANLGVIPEISEALAEIGIVNPFPIQALAIPIAITGTDLIGQARTGTGKTLAFGISLLQRIRPIGSDDYHKVKHPGKPQALVICPTRELALQITRDLQTASTIRQTRILSIYGGVSYEDQIKYLKKGTDVVVGTPGRLLDLVNRKLLDLSQVKVLVLDEADEMLDLGFLPDVEKLLSQLKSKPQTLLFSATMSAPILALAKTYLTQPINIRAEGHDTSATVPDTKQFVYQAHDLDKPEIIGRILQSKDIDKVIIFCRTKRSTQRLADDLYDRGFQAESIHGDLNQKSREKTLKKFRNGKIKVLVATDVAARGIDVQGVSHVINHECPESEMTYIHRIGRTGRAGTKGIAVTLVDWADLTRWNFINKTLELGIPTPIETYSTSEHLYTDLNIEAGVKGKLPQNNNPKKKNEKKDNLQEPKQRHVSQRKTAKDNSAKPRRKRRRIRQGQEVSRNS